MIIFEYSVWAIGKPEVDLKEMCSNADAIVAGRVLSLEVTDKMIRRTRTILDCRDLLLEPTDKRLLQAKFKREYEFGLWQATLTIEQVIKGQLYDEEITVEYPGIKKGQQGVGGGLITVLQFLNPGERVMVFLRTPKPGEESYTFANAFKSAIRITDSQAVTRLLAEPPLDNPEKQIAALLNASLDALPGGRSSLKSDAMSDLINLQGKQAIPAIKALLDRSKEPAVRENCLIALIRMGDCSRLKEAVEFLNSYPGRGQLLSSQIAQVTDTNLVAKYCVPLMRHPSDFVRRDAAYAVWHANLRSAVPQMIKGLEDSDLDTRYNCLMGLAVTLRRPNDWSPSIGLFEKNESEYINRWKTWWEKSGRSEFKGTQGEH